MDSLLTEATESPLDANEQAVDSPPHAKEHVTCKRAPLLMFLGAGIATLFVVLWCSGSMHVPVGTAVMVDQSLTHAVQYDATDMPDGNFDNHMPDESAVEPPLSLVVKRKGSTRVPPHCGSLKQLVSWVAVDDGGNIWQLQGDLTKVGKNQHIYYRNGVSGKCQHVGGGLVQIDVSGNGCYVWGVSDDHKIWFRSGFGGKWQNVAGGLTHVSVANNGDVWGVSWDTKIWFRKGLGGVWQNVPGALKCVSVNGDCGQFVWGVNPGGHIYARVHQHWLHVPGLLKQIEVNKDGVVWGVSSLDQVWRRNGLHNDWQKADVSFHQVSVGSTVWGVSLDYKAVYQDTP